MAKRCTCDHILDTMRHDPRMRLVPAAARYLWMALADSWARLADPGVFKMGSRIGNLQDIAMLVSMAEPDVKTCMGNLTETQLITQDADGAYRIGTVVASVKASVSAQNGRKSLGRPRNGETPDQYQMRLMRVVQGGGGAVSETQEKPDTENPPHARVAAAKLSSIESKAKPAASACDVVALGNQLAEIAGLDPVRGVFNFRPIDAWLSQGATPDLVIDVVQGVASRSSYVPPQTLGYFTKAVLEAVEQDRKRPAPAGQVVERSDLREYLANVERWRNGGMMGQAPEMPVQVAA